MNATTIGRQASTRGLVDAAGHGAKLIIEVSGCDYCQEFEREAVAGEDPLPPFHSNAPARRRPARPSPVELPSLLPKEPNPWATRAGGAFPAAPVSDSSCRACRVGSE